MFSSHVFPVLGTNQEQFSELWTYTHERRIIIPPAVIKHQSTAPSNFWIPVAQPQAAPSDCCWSASLFLVGLEKEASNAREQRQEVHDHVPLICPPRVSHGSGMWRGGRQVATTSTDFLVQRDSELYRTLLLYCFLMCKRMATFVVLIIEGGERLQLPEHSKYMGPNLWSSLV